MRSLLVREGVSQGLPQEILVWLVREYIPEGFERSGAKSW